MKELRNNRIYKLPAGAAYVAVRVGDERFFLYRRTPDAFAHPPPYKVTSEGRVRPWFGGSREWAAEELTDTGKLYDDPKGANRPD